MNINITEYAFASTNNHDPRRKRALLLHKKERGKIVGKMSTKGYSVVPTRLFISNSGFAKITIAIAKGKKLYDKRESIKKKDERRREQRGEE
jgi:SsrA-binding protein